MLANNLFKQIRKGRLRNQSRKSWVSKWSTNSGRWTKERRNGYRDEPPFGPCDYKPNDEAREPRDVRERNKKVDCTSPSKARLQRCWKTSLWALSPHDWERAKRETSTPEKCRRSARLNRLHPASWVSFSPKKRSRPAYRGYKTKSARVGH